MRFFYLNSGAPQPAGHTIQTDCPACNKAGTFNITLNQDYHTSSNHVLGLRRCPNPKCQAAVFFICQKHTASPMIIYPSAKITFSKDGIPDSILRSFEEAITCHSSDCFIASAIMLRKTIEGICDDKKAVGANLFKRLEALSTIIVVPKELIAATHELRLLGNDAAHLEAQTYEQIGKEEIEISIEFTKEILKAVYQYQGLLGKLRGLKKTPSEES